MQQSNKHTLKNKHGDTLELTIHNSYVDPLEYGMTQMKNAMSYEEALKAGYKPI